MWPSRFYILDISRAFASLAVILWHWQHFSDLSVGFVSENQPLYNYFKIFYVEGLKGVEFFFVLSGFVFFLVYKNSIINRSISFKAYFVNRLSRLYPLHFVSLLLVCFLQYVYFEKIGEYFVYENNDWIHFVMNVFLVSNWGFENGFSFNGPIWSVSVEMFLYLIFFVFCFYFFKGWLFVLLISLVSFVFYKISHLFLFLGVALFFMGGVVYKFSGDVFFKHKFLIVPIYFITFCLWVGVFVDLYFIDVENYILSLGVMGTVFIRGFSGYLLFPFTICSMVFLEMKSIRWVSRFAWFGDISYASYLIHFPLQLVFAIFVCYGFLDGELYRSVYFLFLFIGLVIFLSYLSYEYFERPCQKNIRKFFLNDKKLVSLFLLK